MAVLLRHPEVYERLIHSILPAYGIPYFMDRHKQLRFHPLVHLMRRITDILKDSWNTATLISYMKTGFTALTDHQIYALENYCVANGVKRMHWESSRPWRFTPPGEEEHERVNQYMEYLRQKLWQPIKLLNEKLSAAVTADEDVRIRRVMKRDGMRREDVESRMRAQLSDDEFRRRADFVIENNGTVEALKEQVERVYKFVSERNVRPRG
jgi:ATP-dependent helicase/DNAse subunit B